MNPSRANTESETGNAHTIPPVLTLPFNQKIPHQDACPFPDAEELISSLDTIPMFAIRPGESLWQQQDMFINALIEDIARQNTLRLPIIVLAPEKQTLSEQSQVITSTASGAGIAGLGNLMSAVLRYVTNVAMTHIVSPAIYGAFGEVISAVSLLAGLATLGFSGIQTYLLPAYRVKDERGLVNGLVRFSTRITLIAGFLLGVLLFAFAPAIARGFYHAPPYEPILRELAPLIPLMAVLLVFFSGLQSFKQIKWKVSLELGLLLITLIALVIFYLLRWRVEALSFSAIAGYIFSVLLSWIVYSKIVKRFTGDTAPRYTPRVWFGFTLPVLFSEQIFSIANTSDILFLSIFATPAQAGIYIAANRISNLVTMPLTAVNVTSIPLLAEYYAQGKREQLESMFKLVSKWALSLSLPICLCCLVFGDAILGIFGAQYTSGWLVLVILCFANVVGAGTGPVLQLLYITNRLRIVTIDSITHLIFNAGLAFLLVPRFNILGAALASVLVGILTEGLGVIEVYWTMKLHPFRWDMCKPVLAGGVATLVGMLLLHILHLQPGLGPFAVLAELGLIIPFILVYILMLLLLGFSEEDRVVFHTVLARFGRQRSTRVM